MNHSVLIVDDDPLWQAIASTALSAAGIESIATAANGEAAMKQLLADPNAFNTIVTDLNMPDMDGLRFLRALAQSKYSGRLILVSGEQAGILRAAERQAKMFGLNLLAALSKPITPQQIVDILVASGSESNNSNGLDDVSKMDAVRMVTERRLTAHFQPQVDLQSGEITSCEALARCQLPGREILSAAQFVPALVENGFALALFDIVMKQAAAAIRDWHDHGLKIPCSVNLAPSLLDDLELPDRICDLLVLHKVAPSDITIELTEQMTQLPLDNFIEVLTRLRMQGFGLSLDDFGVEASNFDRLSALPFTEVKIDRSLVAGCSDDVAKRATIRAISTIAAQHEMTVLAEGIETQEDFDTLGQLGVDLGQGYFIAMPKTAAEVLVDHGGRPTQSEWNELVERRVKASR